MSDVGQVERRIQDRVVRLFQERLGYRYLGNRQYRPGNSNVEDEDLREWLRRRGTSETLITRTLHRLGQAASLGEGKSLYDANREVYGLLRYGVKVREAAGEPSQTVRLIDWERPEDNDFAVAEEFTVLGHMTKRPRTWCSTLTESRSRCWSSNAPPSPSARASARTSATRKRSSSGPSSPPCNWWPEDTEIL